MATPVILQTCTIKALCDSGEFDSVPSQYAYQKSVPTDVEDPVQVEEIPTIDFSRLAGGTTEQRAQAVRELGKACEEWGFFLVVNHGMPENQMEGFLDTCQSFFNLTEEEKTEYAGKHVLDPIRCGTSFNPTVDEIKYWRDFLKVFMHPVLHSPTKPPRFREITMKYSASIRAMVKVLLKGICESLGLEDCYMEKVMDLENGLQILIANLYPPCPQPELAMGLPPHSDHGLLTVLLQNGVDGLQVKHNGKWVQVKPLPNSFLVNTGDHIEILSNGRYKSILHQAVVNDKAKRMSVAMAHGPSLDTIVVPAPQLVDSKSSPMAYRGMPYREYLEYQQSNRLKGKTVLDLVRVQGD